MIDLIGDCSGVASEERKCVSRGTVNVEESTVRLRGDAESGSELRWDQRHGKRSEIVEVRETLFPLRHTFFVCSNLFTHSVIVSTVAKFSGLVGFLDPESQKGFGFGFG